MFQYCELQKIVMGKYNNAEALWKRLCKTIFIDVMLVVYYGFFSVDSGVYIEIYSSRAFCHQFYVFDYILYGLKWFIL